MKASRKQTPKHITIADLPQEERFKRLGTKSKYLIDTIKMIAYRAETAMVSIIRDSMSRIEDARSLIEAKNHFRMHIQMQEFKITERLGQPYSPNQGVSTLDT